MRAFLNRHPDYRLRPAWNYAQLGLLIFPLIPSLGIIGLLLALVKTWRQRYYKIIYCPFNWGLAVVAIWLVITTGLAFDHEAAFLGLGNFLPFFALFAAFSVLIQTPAQLRQLANIVVVSSVPVVIIGLGQMFLGWVSPVQVQNLLGVAIAPNGNPPGRMSSVFMYTNILAGYLVIVFILGLGLWIETYEARDKSILSQRLGTRAKGNILNQVSPQDRLVTLLKRLFLSVVVIGNLIALILTNSRNAWAIALSASLVFALYKGWLWLVGGVAGIAGSVVWAAFGPSPVQQWLRQVVPAFFWERLTDQMYPNRPLATLRITQWHFAWSLAQQRPWTGWGLRNFTPLYQGQMHVWLGHPHNFFLMLTAEAGIPFTVLFCVWVSWVIFQSIQLLIDWSNVVQLDRHKMAKERLILFSYLVAFMASVVFNTADVSLFDLRLNTLIWLLLSGICGVVNRHREYSLKHLGGASL